MRKKQNTLLTISILVLLGIVLIGAVQGTFISDTISSFTGYFNSSLLINSSNGTYMLMYPGTSGTTFSDNGSLTIVKDGAGHNPHIELASYSTNNTYIDLSFYLRNESTGERVKPLAVWQAQVVGEVDNYLQDFKLYTGDDTGSLEGRFVCKLGHETEPCGVMSKSYMRYGGITHNSDRDGSLIAFGDGYGNDEKARIFFNESDDKLYFTSYNGTTGVQLQRIGIYAGGETTSVELVNAHLWMRNTKEVRLGETPEGKVYSDGSNLVLRANKDGGDLLLYTTNSTSSTVKIQVKGGDGQQDIEMHEEVDMNNHIIKKVASGSTFYAPNGSLYTCGPANDGTWSCS